MKQLKIRNKPASGLVTTAALAALVVAGATAAQDPQTGDHADSEHEQHGEHAQEEEDLLGQIAEIRASVARLEAALEQNHQGVGSGSTGSSSGDASSAMGMGMGMGMGMMGGHGKSGMSSMGEQGDMQSMPRMKMGGMKSMDSGSGMSMGGMNQGSMKRMDMMGRMGGMGAAEPAAALSRLPGFPGASHIYHIGASGFFLDHADHAQLSRDQRAQLARIQEQSTLDQADSDRQVAGAEQGLWVLTSAGTPDAAAIEAKVREIAKLTADQRIAFIRSVGEAAEVLTDEQRSKMVGDLGAEFEEGSQPAGQDASGHKH
jgi:Spy/CpxP family protein refolding chaperone